MEIINGEYVLNAEESLALLTNRINRLNPVDPELQSFIDSIEVEFTDDCIIVSLPEDEV